MRKNHLVAVRIIGRDYEFLRRRAAYRKTTLSAALRRIIRHAGRKNEEFKKAPIG